jgi:hypothetical protein
MKQFLTRGAGAVSRGVTLMLTVALVMLAYAVVPAVLAHIGVAGAHVIGHAAPLTAMILIPWQPALSKDSLDSLVSPILPSQPEVVPWQLYDTQNATTAVAAPLTYFVNQNNDRTLSNMEGPGQLPDPQYFVCYYIACDIMQVPVATALAGEPNAGIANVENLLKTARTTLTFTMSNKNYGPFSLTMCHATGGTTGFAYGYGTAANGTSAAVANNGIPGYGGFPFSGALVIPPKTGFSLTLSFGVAPTLVGGPIPIRMSLVGALYRKVV